MKTFYTLLVGLLAFAACKKDEQPKITAANARMNTAGTFTRVTFTGDRTPYFLLLYDEQGNEVKRATNPMFPTAANKLTIDSVPPGTYTAVLLSFISSISDVDINGNNSLNQSPIIRLPLKDAYVGYKFYSYPYPSAYATYLHKQQLVVSDTPMTICAKFKWMTANLTINITDTLPMDIGYIRIYMSNEFTKFKILDEVGVDPTEVDRGYGEIDDYQGKTIPKNLISINTANNVKPFDVKIGLYNRLRQLIYERTITGVRCYRDKRTTITGSMATGVFTTTTGKW